MGAFMRYLRSILWVPMLFGIVMGGLATTKLVSDGIGANLVSIPGEIVDAYTQVTSALFYYAFTVPFRLPVTDGVANIAVFWFVCIGCNWRFATRAYSEKIQIYSDKISRLKYILVGIKEVNRIKYIFYVFITVISGPLGLVYFIYHLLFTIFRRAKAIRVSYRHASDYGEIDVSASEIHHENAVDFKKSSRFFEESLKEITIIILANPIIAAGMLWWNAAEIERLTAGIG